MHACMFPPPRMPTHNAHNLTRIHTTRSCLYQSHNWYLNPKPQTLIEFAHGARTTHARTTHARTHTHTHTHTRSASSRSALIKTKRGVTERYRSTISCTRTRTHARRHRFIRARFSLTQEHVFAICLDHNQAVREHYDIFIVQPCRGYSCFSFKCWCVIIYLIVIVVVIDYY
jgi:hypothetical protein